MVYISLPQMPKIFELLSLVSSGFLRNRHLYIRYYSHHKVLGKVYKKVFFTATEFIDLFYFIFHFTSPSQHHFPVDKNVN